MGMLAVYRHDAHKFTGHAHANAPETFAGVPVNQEVPEGADSDAAALSRPQGQRKPTVANHRIRYRLSLLTGESHWNDETFSRRQVTQQIHDLLTIEDAEKAHRAWLDSDVAGLINESVYHPYTSLKYHTLLVAGLFDNYRAGSPFEKLRLIVDPSDTIVPHRTVYTSDRFTLRIDRGVDDRPAARLGDRPRQSWASTWNRLTAHPLDTGSSKYDMLLDANLRRIRSWSTGLQYIEDYHA